jgi:hypothetical protein
MEPRTWTKKNEEMIAEVIAQMPITRIVVAHRPALLRCAEVVYEGPDPGCKCPVAVNISMVTSLAHPGGNVAGLSVQQTELVGKRFELLRHATWRRDGGMPAGCASQATKLYLGPTLRGREPTGRCCKRLREVGWSEGRISNRISLRRDAANVRLSPVSAGWRSWVMPTIPPPCWKWTGPRQRHYSRNPAGGGHRACIRRSRRCAQGPRGSAMCLHDPLVNVPARAVPVPQVPPAVDRDRSVSCLRAPGRSTDALAALPSQNAPYLRKQGLNRITRNEAQLPAIRVSRCREARDSQRRAVDTKRFQDL